MEPYCSSGDRKETEVVDGAKRGRYKIYKSGIETEATEIIGGVCDPRNYMMTIR